MPGRIVSSPATQHVCEGRPDLNFYAPGTLWECSDCNMQWVVVVGSQYNELYSAWRVLTPQNQGGADK